MANPLNPIIPHDLLQSHLSLSELIPLESLNVAFLNGAPASHLVLLSPAPLELRCNLIQLHLIAGGKQPGCACIVYATRSERQTHLGRWQSPRHKQITRLHRDQQRVVLWSHDSNAISYKVMKIKLPGSSRWH